MKIFCKFLVITRCVWMMAVLLASNEDDDDEEWQVRVDPKKSIDHQTENHNTFLRACPLYRIIFA